MRRSVRGSFSALVAAALVVASALYAEVAAAESVTIGEPEPDQKLDDGVVAVRLIGDGADKPIAGESVMLVGDGDAVLTARTSAAGWARFPNLSEGAEYRARVEIDEQTLETSPIVVPAEGGVRVTLSTEQQAPQHKPAGAPGQRARGMPDPRQMSGVPRGEGGDPPGQLTVRAVQGEFSPTASTAPEGAVIHLVGFGVDGSVTRESMPVDDDGRAVFKNLATDRSRAYYALALFNRGEVQDRLLSSPVSMPQSAGVRLMLAGPAADSDEEIVDDVIEQVGTTGAPLPPGQVVARLVGRVNGVREVELIEVGDPDSPQRSPAGPPSPIPSDVQGDLSKPQPDDALRDGLVVVSVRGQGESLGGARVTIAPEDGGEPREHRTNSSGEVRVDDLVVGSRHRAIINVHGREFTSEVFEVPAQGGVRVRLRATWQVGGGMLEARFRDVPSGADKVYAAQVRVGDRVYRSLPFQLTSERGAAAGVVVFDDVLLSFQFRGEVDDERLWFGSDFGLRNPTTAPILPEGGKLSVPLPKGFASASVHDDDQTRVRVGSEGFIWRGPVGPGRELFRGQFSIPIKNGTFELDMPLPHGSWDSQVIMERLPGMTLRLPDVQGMQEETRPLGDREFTLLSDINIEHGRRLVIGGEGLPRRSASETYLRWAAGIVAIGLLIWGFAGLFRRRGDGAGEDRAAVLERERERLLDELAELERQYKEGEVTEARYTRSRDNLRIELESVYAELGVGERTSS